MLYRGYTFRLHPTPEQAEKLARFAGVCRLVWNLALEQRRDHWRRYQAVTGGNLNRMAQSRELTLLRAQYDFIREVPQAAEQRALVDLEEAFMRMWRNGAGFPRAKKKGVHDAFSFAGRDVSFKLTNAKWGLVRVPKIGWVKYRSTRLIKGVLKEASFAKTALGWQVSATTGVDATIADNGRSVGVDRGVKIPIALSDGGAFQLPTSLLHLEKRARKAQRDMSRRKRGSNRYLRARRRVASIKARQARVRKHWAHCATTAITRKYSTVIIERLRTKAMTASAAGTVDSPGRGVAQKRGLNKAILNVGWHQIERMLAYKSARLVKVNPALSSQTCSACGAVDNRSRESQAIFICTTCGHRDNADRNAAAVILQRGNTALLDVEGRGYAPGEASTARLATAA